jgi:hypothetical protein
MTIADALARLVVIREALEVGDVDYAAGLLADLEDDLARLGIKGPA